MIKKEILCDICSNTVAEDNNHVQVPMQIIFTTETTEGRSTQPYFDTIKIDICDTCTKKALEGNYIFASGAMGYNQYWFNTNRKI